MSKSGFWTFQSEIAFAIFLFAMLMIASTLAMFHGSHSTIISLGTIVPFSFLQDDSNWSMIYSVACHSFHRCVCILVASLQSAQRSFELISVLTEDLQGQGLLQLMSSSFWTPVVEMCWSGDINYGCQGAEIKQVRVVSIICVAAKYWLRLSYSHENRKVICRHFQAK